MNEMTIQVCHYSQATTTMKTTRTKTRTLPVSSDRATRNNHNDLNSRRRSRRTRTTRDNNKGWSFPSSPSSSSCTSPSSSFSSNPWYSFFTSSSLPIMIRLFVWSNVVFCLLVIIPKSSLLLNNNNTTETDSSNSYNLFTTTTISKFINGRTLLMDHRNNDEMIMMGQTTTKAVLAATSSSHSHNTNGGGDDTTDVPPVPVKIVAYVVSITSCPPKLRRSGHQLYDMASVLATSIKMNSLPPYFSASAGESANKSKTKTTKYASDLVVLTTPQTNNTVCVQQLIDAGFTTIKQFDDFPVSPSDIRENGGDDSQSQQQQQQPILKQQIANDGCCGHYELIKLQIYSLTEYEVAIHLDLDTLLLRPLDPILDAMVYPIDHPVGQKARQRLVYQPPPTTTTTTSNEESGRSGSTSSSNSTTGSQYVRLSSMTWNHYNKNDISSRYTNTTSSLVVKNDGNDDDDEHARQPVVLPPNVEAYYTKDYNMLPRGKTKVGIQGGVLIVKPNITRRDLLVEMVKSGEFYPGRDAKSGWFHSGYGKHIWGSMTIQGLLGYYYNEVEPLTSVELNRCRFNQIGENPRRSSYGGRPGIYPRGTAIDPSDIRYNATYVDEECRDGRGQNNDDDGCDDVQCQTYPLDETFIVHYTYCKSPMNCPDISYNETWKDHQCSLMHREWFKVRKLLSSSQSQTLQPPQQQLPMPPLPSGSFSNYNNSDGQGQQEQQQDDMGSYYPSHFFGFCNGPGPENYIPLAYPPPPSLPS